MAFKLDKYLDGYANPKITEEFYQRNLYNDVSKDIIHSMNVFMLNSISMFQTNKNSKGRFCFSDYHFMISRHPLPKVYVDGKEYEPSSGLLAFNPGTELYSEKTVKSDYYIAMRVDKDFIFDIAQQMDIKSPVRFEQISNGFSPEFNTILTGAICELYRGQTCKVMLDSFSVQIAVMLLRAMKGDIRTYNQYLKYSYIDQAINFMHENYSRNISIDVICSNVHISSFHFLREFKKVTGITPHQYLMKIRLEKAVSLLKANDMPITQIAIDCGFSSPSHFSAAFRKKFGINPSAYFS